MYVGVLCFKKLADVRCAKLREVMSGPLVELATSKALQWCCSKPHTSNLTVHHYSSVVLTKYYMCVLMYVSVYSHEGFQLPYGYKFLCFC